MKLALENRLILFSEEMPIKLKSLESNLITTLNDKDLNIFQSSRDII